MVNEWDMRTNAKSLGYTFRKFLQFSQKEMRAVVITILILTFIVAFNDQSESFELAAWMLNFAKWLIIVTIVFTSFVLGQRAASLYEGYIPEYQLWWYGLMFGLIISFVSRGYIWLLLPGGMMFHMSTVHRTGEFRYGQTSFLMSKISMFGPFTCLALGMLIKTPEVWFGISIINAEFVSDFFLFAIALAAYSLLPVPPLPGSKMFFESRLVYAFIAGAFIGYAVLIMFNIYSILLALVIGGITWFLFWAIWERGAWKF